MLLLYARKLAACSCHRSRASRSFRAASSWILTCSMQGVDLFGTLPSQLRVASRHRREQTFDSADICAGSAGSGALQRRGCQRAIAFVCSRLFGDRTERPSARRHRQARRHGVSRMIDRRDDAAKNRDAIDRNVGDLCRGDREHDRLGGGWRPQQRHVVVRFARRRCRDQVYAEARFSSGDPQARDRFVQQPQHLAHIVAAVLIMVLRPGGEAAASVHRQLQPRLRIVCQHDCIQRRGDLAGQRRVIGLGAVRDVMRVSRGLRVLLRCSPIDRGHRQVHDVKARIARSARRQPRRSASRTRADRRRARTRRS